MRGHLRSRESAPARPATALEASPGRLLPRMRMPVRQPLPIRHVQVPHKHFPREARTLPFRHRACPGPDPRRAFPTRPRTSACQPGTPRSDTLLFSTLVLPLHDGPAMHGKHLLVGAALAITLAASAAARAQTAASGALRSADSPFEL